MVRAANAGTLESLKTAGEEVARSVRRIDSLVSGLDPDVSLALIGPLSRLRNNAIGSSSIIAARQTELTSAAEGRRLTVENSVLSGGVSNAVDALVAQSKLAIAVATAQTHSVQKYGSLGLLLVVALSLISSVLIVWLYVGRNIVARLTALSDRMLALAAAISSRRCRLEGPTRSAGWRSRWRYSGRRPSRWRKQTSKKSVKREPG